MNYKYELIVAYLEAQLSLTSIAIYNKISRRNPNAIHQAMINDFPRKFQSSIVGKNYDFFHCALDQLASFHLKFRINTSLENFINEEIKTAFEVYESELKDIGVYDFSTYVKNLLWYHAHQCAFVSLQRNKAKYIVQLESVQIDNIKIIKVYPLLTQDRKQGK